MTTQEFVDAYNVSVKIETYPEMNERIKELLRMGCEPMYRYAAARIEELEQRCAELEQQNAVMLTVHRETCEACGCNDDCQHDTCAVFKCRAFWGDREAEADREPSARFAKLKACRTPEDMAFILNTDERRFCPKEYTSTEK